MINHLGSKSVTRKIPGPRIGAGVLLCAVACFWALPVQAQHRHVHGEGRLSVAIEKQVVTLNLELPLDVLVGFERAPKNESEKSALRAAETRLKNAEGLWLPTPAAKCTLQSVAVEMPDFSGGEHADVDADYRFQCAEPAALKSIETTLFKEFKRLYRLETQRVGPQTQGAQRLSPKNPRLSW